MKSRGHGFMVLLVGFSGDDGTCSITVDSLDGLFCTGTVLLATNFLNYFHLCKAGQLKFSSC